MEATEIDDLARLRELADSLGCMIDEDLQLLTKTLPSTTDAWRKRGQGPEYIRVGNRPLYPRAGVAQFMQSRKRERAATGKALL